MTQARWSLVLGLALTVLSAPGCRTVKEAYAHTLLTGEILSYEEYLSIGEGADPHPTAQQVLDRLGEPEHVEMQNGKRFRIRYHAFSIMEMLKRAEFVFDEDERLTKKDLW